MRRKIDYWQDISEYDPDTYEIVGKKREYLSIISENDAIFEEHIATIKGYCGDDYTVTELPAEINSEVQLRADVDYIAMMTGVDL